MKCSKCSNNAVFTNPTLCKEHFIEYFETKVKDTIKQNNMIQKQEKVCVAASGGKDSITTLYLLHKFGYNVEALAVDEGIEGYRDHTLAFLKDFCEEKGIILHIKSYQEEVGKRLDTVVPKGRPACNICGTFRRHLLNKYTQDYDKIATGHNLDDESQAVLMNLLKAQINLFARQGPKTKQIKGFTQKIKPLYLMKEKEIMTYSYIKGFNTPYNECPYAKDSYRAHVRDLLNSIESKNPGTKINLINKYLSIREGFSQDKEIRFCEVCNSPCSSQICKACRLKKQVKAV